MIHLPVEILQSKRHNQLISGDHPDLLSAFPHQLIWEYSSELPVLEKYTILFTFKPQPPLQAKEYKKQGTKQIEYNYITCGIH